MTRQGRTRIEGWLILALALISLVGFWYVKSLFRAPSTVDLSPMPEEEFAQNDGLGMPNEQSPVDYELNRENVFFLLGQYKTPEALLWEVSTTIYGNGKSRTLQGVYIKKQADFDIKIFEGASMIKQVIKSKGEITVSRGGSVYRTVYSENYKPTAVLGMADLEFIMGIPEKNILEAKMGILDGREVLYVEFKTENFDISEKYWISLDYGLPLKVESYLENEMIYSATTNAIS